ncbi:MAG: hypothetical protein WD077_13090 [Bacteroidia bacterium]
MKHLLSIVIISIFGLISYINNSDLNNENTEGSTSYKDAIDTQVVDSTGCISTGCETNCWDDIICPNDTIRYRTTQVMQYVDDNLANGEPKVLECSCGRNYYILGNDTIEIYLFLYGSGAGAVWYRMYKKEKDGKFEHLESFNPENEGYVEVLNSLHYGVRDFIFDEVQGPKYTLSFNGTYFDTIAVERRKK